MIDGNMIYNQSVLSHISRLRSSEGETEETGHTHGIFSSYSIQKEISGTSSLRSTQLSRRQSGSVPTTLYDQLNTEVHMFTVTQEPDKMNSTQSMLSYHTSTIPSDVSLFPKASVFPPDQNIQQIFVDEVPTNDLPKIPDHAFTARFILFLSKCIRVVKVDFLQRCFQKLRMNVSAFINLNRIPNLGVNTYTTSLEEANTFSVSCRAAQYILLSQLLDLSEDHLYKYKLSAYTQVSKSQIQATCMSWELQKSMLLDKWYIHPFIYGGATNSESSSLTPAETLMMGKQYAIKKPDASHAKSPKTTRANRRGSTTQLSQGSTASATGTGARQQDYLSTS